jgi:hypothetical protein
MSLEVKARTNIARTEKLIKVLISGDLRKQSPLIRILKGELSMEDLKLTLVTLPIQAFVLYIFYQYIFIGG